MEGKRYHCELCGMDVAASASSTFPLKADKGFKQHRGVCEKKEAWERRFFAATGYKRWPRERDRKKYLEGHITQMPA